MQIVFLHFHTIRVLYEYTMDTAEVHVNELMGKYILFKVTIIATSVTNDQLKVVRINLHIAMYAYVGTN